MLDMRTVLFSYVISNAICTLVMSILWGQNCKRFAGLGFWLGDFILQALAVLLIVLRGIAPDVVSIVLANVLVIGGTMLLYIGLERYVGKKSTLLYNGILLAGFILVQIYFTYVQPSLFARTQNGSIGLLLVCAQCAWLMLRRVDAERRSETRLVGVVFVAYCLVIFARILIDLTLPQVKDLFRLGLFDALVILVYQMIFIGLTFSLFLMVNRRLFAVLEQDILARGIAEAAKEKSEEKLSVTFQNIPDAIIITSILDGKIIEANDGFFRISEFTREEIDGKTTIDLQLWGSLSDRVRFVDELQRNGRVQNFETNFRRKSGELFLGWISGEIINLQGLVCALNVIHDISQHKQAEIALKASEYLYRSLYESIPVGIYRATPDGQIMDANPALLQMLMYPDTESLLASNSKQSYVEPAEREQFQSLIKRDGLVNGFESQWRRFDGKIIWVRENTRAICDELGEVLYYEGAVEDITQRKAAETQLAYERSLMNALMDNAPFAIYFKDLEGRFIKVNRNLASKHGLDNPEQAIGKTDFDFFVPENAQTFYESEQEIINSGISQENIEEIEFWPDEPPTWGSSTKMPLRDTSGAIIGTIGITRDITRRKLAEEENTRLSNETQRRIQQLQVLREIDLAIVGSLDLKMIMKTIVDQVTQTLGVNAADVLVLNPYALTLEYAYGSGFRTKTLQCTALHLGEGCAGKAAYDRRLVSIPDLRGHTADFLRSPEFLDEEFVSYYAIPLISKGQVKGVLETFFRSLHLPDQNWIEFLAALADQTAIAIDSNETYHHLQNANLELSLAYDATLEGWSRALDLRDKETEGHSQRVTQMAMMLAQKIGLNDEELIHIRRGALLHDIGKMGIPDSILQKPGPLSDEEWVIMRRHPQQALNLLSPIAFLKSALDIPYCHHEKWDGTGYPRRLKGEQIPLAARIFALVDVWDALTSDRPYRPAWSFEKANSYLREQAGKHFDPKIVKVFLETIPQWSADNLAINHTISFMAQHTA